MPPWRQKIKDLQATLEARKKYLEQYRTSRTLLAEADALYKQATQDPDIQSASPKYDEAAAKYRKSLSLYRPFNAENIEKTISVLELNKHERWVKKYWADGQELEKQGKLVEALAAYDKAIASLHPTTDQRSRLWYETYAQEIRNKINGAKQLRAQGEAQQKQGKIPDAIASYRQSLKLVPDKALEDHVRLLEAEAAKGSEKKAAGRAALAGGHRASQPGKTKRCALQVQGEPLAPAGCTAQPIRPGPRRQKDKGTAAQGRRSSAAAAEPRSRCHRTIQ